MFVYLPEDSPLRSSAQEQGTAAGTFARGTLYQLSDTAGLTWGAEVTSGTASATE